MEQVEGRRKNIRGNMIVWELKCLRACDVSKKNLSWINGKERTQKRQEKSNIMNPYGQK